MRGDHLAVRRSHPGRRFAVTIALVMLIPAGLYASARFDDVAATSPFAGDIAWLAESGVTKGCGDGTKFCPDEYVTRQQMAAFLHRLATNQVVDAMSVQGLEPGDMQQGVQGPAGPPGPQGPEGPAGPQGEPGVVPDNAKTYTGHLLIHAAEFHRLGTADFSNDGLSWTGCGIAPVKDLPDGAEVTEVAINAYQVVGGEAGRVSFSLSYADPVIDLDQDWLFSASEEGDEGWIRVSANELNPLVDHPPTLDPGDEIYALTSCVEGGHGISAEIEYNMP